MKYSVYKSEMSNIVAGYYELTGKTSSEELLKGGYEFVCFAKTAKEADEVADTLWTIK